MVVGAAVFGARLRACRRSAGLSQEELAVRSGLSVRTISNLERGCVRWPHPGSVHRLADALGLRGEVRRALIADAGRRLGGRGEAGAVTPPGDQVAGAGRGWIVPRQLPASVRQFVGRERELAALNRLADQVDGAAGAVVISALGGTAGVGKTALALRWAHQVAGRFPDGQLYLNLRGFDPSGTPMPPAEAVRGLLDGVGVPAGQIPASADAQAGLYRSLLSGRRMLLVLDNARDEEQVRPLLPGSPGCLVVVTSRRHLAGLVAVEGACALTLDVLTGAEAQAMLAQRLGPARLEREPGGVADLIGLCARLPLALAVAAARVSARPHLRLSCFAAELNDARRRLDALDAGDRLASVRAVFSWSLASLPAPAVRMFGLLGVHPGPDITVPAAASLAGVRPGQAGQALAELTRAHLLTAPACGRYACHDLLRAYAAEQAAALDGQDGRHAAAGRVLDHYLHTAHAAALLLSPSRTPVTLAAPRPQVTPERLASYQEALDWFEAERQVLLAAVTLAAETGFDVHGWQLPWALADFLDRRGHWHDGAALQRTALAAATRLGDTLGQAMAGRALGKACAWLTDYDQARGHLADSLSRYRQLGDRDGQARVHQSLNWVCERQARYGDALGHAEQALALFQAADDQAGQAAALNAIGWCHVLLGDPQRARTFCHRALALNRERGNRRSEALTWDSLGYAEHQVGRFAKAAACYRRALHLFQECGDRFYEAEILTHLGNTRHAAGDPQEARAAWQAALDILDDLRHPDADEVRAKLGLIRRAPSDPAPAM